MNDGFEPFQLSGGDVTPESRQPIVAPALVVQRRVGPFVCLGDEAIRQQAPERRIETAGADLDVAAGPAAHFFDDGVAVLVAVGEREQHVKHERRQGQERTRLAIARSRHW